MTHEHGSHLGNQFGNLAQLFVKSGLKVIDFIEKRRDAKLRIMRLLFGCTTGSLL